MEEREEVGVGVNVTMVPRKNYWYKIINRNTNSCFSFDKKLKLCFGGTDQSHDRQADGRKRRGEEPQQQQLHVGAVAEAGGGGGENV